MRQLAFLFAALLLLAGGSRVLADAQEPDLRRRRAAHRQAALRQLPRQRQAEGRPQPRHLRRRCRRAARPAPSSCPATRTSRGSSRSPTTRTSRRCRRSRRRSRRADSPRIKLWIEQGAQENAGSKVSIPRDAQDRHRPEVGREGPARRPAADARARQAEARSGRGRAAARRGARAGRRARGRRSSPSAGRSRSSSTTPTPAHLLGVLPFEHGQINSIKFSRNAKFVLVAGGKGGQSGKAVLFNVETGEKVLEVGIARPTRSSPPTSPPTRRRSPSAGPSKLVRIYSTTDGSVLREIKKHTDWVTAVEYSPDGVLLATGDRNGGLFVWEAFTGREYFSLRGHTAMITDVSWRDDSNVLASCSEDTTVKLWEMENGGNIKNWGAHGGGAASVQVHARRQARHRPAATRSRSSGTRTARRRSRSRRSPIWGCGSRSRTTTRR